MEDYQGGDNKEFEENGESFDSQNLPKDEIESQLKEVQKLFLEFWEKIPSNLQETSKNKQSIIVKESINTLFDFLHNDPDLKTTTLTLEQTEDSSRVLYKHEREDGKKNNCFNLEIKSSIQMRNIVTHMTQKCGIDL